jgi:hypothetical protein
MEPTCLMAARKTTGDPLNLAPAPLASFDLSKRKGRYGVAYLRNICAQFGVGLDETSPDEDAHAFDCAVKFRVGNVPVQVKCTSKSFSGGTHLTMPVKQEWKEAWAGYIAGPAYFLVVRVPDTADEWIDHTVDHQTTHRTAAYWERIDGREIGASIQVHHSNRFSASTLNSWHEDVLRANGFAP